MKDVSQINIEDFLQDIPGENPVGVFLRYAADYDNIREALREEDDLPQGVWVRDIKLGDWETASTLCQNVLINKSKDLQVASWLWEAWMFLYGMPGFLRGLNLMYALSQRYWENIYPAITNGALDYRLSPFYWANEKLADRMNRLLITSPSNTDLRSYPFGNWVELSRLQGLRPAGDRPNPSTNAPLEQIGTRKNPTLLDFNESLDKTDASFYEDMQSTIKECLASLQNFSIFLDQTMGKDSPTLYRLKNKLTDFLKFTTQTLSERGRKISPPTVEIIQPQPMATEGIASPVEDKNERIVQEFVNPQSSSDLSEDSIQNRDHAYALVDSAINYLKTHDPHSPIPYLIEKISSWRSMTFMDIMDHLTDDQKTNFLEIIKDAYVNKK